MLLSRHNMQVMIRNDTYFTQVKQLLLHSKVKSLKKKKAILNLMLKPFGRFLQLKRDTIPLPQGDILGRLLHGLPYHSAAHRHNEEIRPHGSFPTSVFASFWSLLLVKFGGCVLVNIFNQVLNVFLCPIYILHLSPFSMILKLGMVHASNCIL